MIITFWDKGNNCEIAIVKERIVLFSPASSRDGTMITVDGLSSYSNPRFSSVWVKESFEEVKKRMEQAE